MSPDNPPPARKIPLAKLLIAAVVMALVAAIVLQAVGWRTAWDETVRVFNATLDVVAAAGPVVFYTAMAILPVFGAPMGPFAIASGLVFRDQLGLPVVVLLGVTAMMVNISLAYWLARRWLRPPLTRLITRWGYKLPQVDRGDMTDLIVLLRVTPGPPFFVQNYLLGLAEVPFGRYLVISCATQGLLLSGLVIFGNALGQGRGKVVILAACMLVAILFGTHLVRKQLAKKKKAS